MTAYSTVTTHPNQAGKLLTEPEPTFQVSKPILFWGLCGEHRVDVKQLCSATGVKQLQTQATSKDVIFGVLTLGIYAPHTVEVGCK